MVEVFKTNVGDQDHANMLVDQIQKVFIGYKANFDLEDCDKILRVKCTTGIIDALRIINFFEGFGFHAEILPDDPLPVHSTKAGEQNISSPRFYIPEVSGN